MAIFLVASGVTLIFGVLRILNFAHGAFFMLGAYVAFSLWLPSYYKTVYHLSLGKSALLTALFIFPASLLRPVGGWLSDRYGARPVTYAVFVVMLMASLVLGEPLRVNSAGRVVGRTLPPASRCGPIRAWPEARPPSSQLASPSSAPKFNGSTARSARACARE